MRDDEAALHDAAAKAALECELVLISGGSSVV
jgi:molybdopterin biosynthesis enzyme